MAFLTYIIFFLIPQHSFHISVTNLTYNTTGKSLELTQRIFLDDLEKAMQVYEGNHFSIDDPKAKITLAINEFITSRTSFLINDKFHKPIFLGYKIEDEMLVAFMEVKKIGKVRTLEVSCSLLLDLYADQINLVHFSETGDEKIKTNRLDMKTPSLTLISR